MIVLTSICSLLGDPNFDSPHVLELQYQYLEDPLAFETQALIFTQRYAQRNEPGPDEPSTSIFEACVRAFCWNYTAAKLGFHSCRRTALRDCDRGFSFLI